MLLPSIRILTVLAFVLLDLGSATAQVQEVRTEAKLFEVNRSRLMELGIPLRGVSAERLESDFIINIPEKSLQGLITGLGSRLLQRFQLTTTGETPAEFRIASRVTSNQTAAESQLLDVGFDFRLLTRVSLKREISMTLISQAKIRNLDTAGNESATPISGEAIRHEITTAEGASVAAGGFITGMDTQQLSRIDTLRESPVFKYLFPSGKEDQTELVVVLTPQLVHALDVPASPSDVPAVRPPIPTIVLPAPKKTSTKAAQFTVQVAAFRTEAKAGEYAMELNKKYPDVFVDTLETPAKGFLRYRVRVGHLSTVNAAKELENQLRSEGLEPFVSPLN